MNHPHTFILGLINESHINMGRQLLASCLIGEDDDRIKKLRLNKLFHYGSLPLYDKKDIFDLTDALLKNYYIEYKEIKNHIKVLSITEKGKIELKNPKFRYLKNKSLKGHYRNIIKVNDQDKKIFKEVQELKDLSDEQKKAVICPRKNILCIAGAGTGKTRALTNRIWYLIKYRSVPQEEILAITFTRKAKQEMIERLDKMIPNNIVNIETFNSFCEKFLRKNEELVYGCKYNVLDYRKKVEMFIEILKENSIRSDYLIENYFSKRKLFSEDKKTLFLRLVNDVFSIIDHQQNNDLTDDEVKKIISQHKLGLEINNIVKSILDKKQEKRLRDYTDQITHTIDFFTENKHEIPHFKHILIDEYQDINSLQFELISLLNPDNVFAVGDPRQSIYGWRGSKIEYILDFEELFSGAAILELNMNYRSTESIVQLGNKIIKSMRLPNLKSYHDQGEEVVVLKQKNETLECRFVCESIKSQVCNRNDIFVLARTNKQIEKLSEQMDQAGIKYLKRTVEEQKTNLVPKKDQVTISTIHAIKGLEADVVYIIGANQRNHPCKASEHPLLDSIKNYYDKESEELRLFYVAITRAKSRLIINYSGTKTKYLNNGNFKSIILHKNNIESDLREWRTSKSFELGVAPYQIFSDRTLMELIDKRPMSKDELRLIPGFGSYKLRMFGREILSIIRNHS